MGKDWTGNGKSVWSALGASNHTDKEREPNDFYATDPAAVRKLESVFPLRRRVWECGCGQGHLSEALKEAGHDVLSTDLVDRGYGTGGVDFLRFGRADDGTPFYGSLLPPGQGGWDRVKGWLSDGEPFDIVTNPPYKFATEFVLKALELVPEGGRVAMLLRTLFLEGTERRRLIFDVNPPRRVFQFSGRVVCAKNGDFEAVRRIGTAMSFAWFVWERRNPERRCEVGWI